LTPNAPTTSFVSTKYASSASSGTDSTDVLLPQAKTSFFSSISHELRTPLTLILGPLEDVLKSKEELQPDHRQKLNLVQRHSIRLLNMVNKLLDYSSLEGGKLQIKFRPVKLGAVTRDLATLFRDAVERGGLQFIVDCDDDPPDTQAMYVAMDLWEKVIYNIVGVSPALSFSRQGFLLTYIRLTERRQVLPSRFHRGHPPLLHRRSCALGQGHWSRNPRR
jgi:K+-sensing histidine kinase KdpD